MTVLASKPWNFAAFDHQGKWYITYMAGSAAMYEVTIRLTEQEVSKIHSEPDVAKMLADRMRVSPQEYKDREVRPSLWPAKNQGQDYEPSHRK